jgi:oxygen-independent coproporphyrinogen-3 oxidase
MLLYRDRLGCADSLYLGGGTPTVLDPAALAGIMACVRQNFSLSADAEITIEANPNDITPESARAMRRLGINRISIGVQSFDDRVLSFLRRRHSAAEARGAIATARAAGFETISIDLMYAVPGQSRAGWMRTLRAAAGFAPEHISCYQLTIKEGTPLRQLEENGAIEKRAASEEESFFLTTAAFLEASGYSQYEVSSFARHEQYYARHNQKYWQHIPYLGLGPGAHSFLDNTRWWNCASVADYIQALGAGRAPVAGAEALSDEQRRLETLVLRFRTSRGIERNFFAPYRQSAGILSRLAAARLIRIEKDRIIPTTHGLLVADSIPQLFL